MKVFKLSLISMSLVFAPMALAVEAAVDSGIYNERTIAVGTSTEGATFLVADERQAAQNKWTANNKAVTFKKIAGKAGSWTTPSNVVKKDNNGVYVVRMYNMKGGIWSIIPMPDHSGLGRMSFAQAGNQDVWYGDWADVPAGAANGSAGTNYSVYYAGTGATTNLPTSGSATYTVKGINNHVAHNTAVLTGSLEANFGNRTLKGSLSRTDLTLGIDANINNDASFKGDAVANGVKGNTQGQFFGHQGAALAGIATFATDNQLNTAFGGTKD